MADWLSAALAALLGGGLVAGLAQLITAHSAASKSDMERVLALVNELQEDNAALRAGLREVEQHYAQKCAEYERTIQTLRAELARLQDLMRACGVDPERKPESRVRL